MKLDRKKLLDSLLLLRPALQSGGLLPEFSHIWFKGQHAFAFNGKLGIRVELDSGLECGVPGEVLLSLLGTSNLPETRFDFSDDNSALVLRMGRSTSRLPILDMSRSVWPFPNNAPAGDNSIKMTDDLLRALKFMLLVEAPKQETRVEHKGVLVWREKKSTALVATNSVTIALARLSSAFGAVNILPRAFVEQIVQSCHVGDRLCLFDDHLAAIGDGIELFAKVVDVDEIHDVRAIADDLRKAHPKPIPIPNGLKIALDRAVILDDNNDAVIRLEINGDDLIVAGTLKYGELLERLQLKAKHPEARTNFSAKMVLHGLDEAESLSLSEHALLLYGDAGIFAVAPRRSVELDK